MTTNPRIEPSRAHWLARLLAPRSVALIGASPREHSLGRSLLDTVCSQPFEGSVYPVNPRYPEIDGWETYAGLGALPEVPDLAIFAVGGLRLERLIDEAIELGVGGAVVFSNAYLAEDDHPPLLARLRHRARAARFPVCGGNAMGFYNYDKALFASFIAPAGTHQRPGGITMVAHSGSVFVMLASGDPRFRYNLAISPGQEIGATVSDYMDYALSLPTTRVIALFIEAVRDPEGFQRALERARAADVPVVVLKVGRTELSARLAQSHSGALAGDDAAFGAVCERYGALRVSTLDELMASAVLLAHTRRCGQGGFAALLDSGGLRELMMDTAADIGVPFARISTATTHALAAELEHGLEPVNPLDAAGSFATDFSHGFERCLPVLMDDPDTAIGAFEFEARNDLVYMPRFVEIAKRMGRSTRKTFFVLNSLGVTRNDAIAADLLDAGVPLINGVEVALRAVRHALTYRDYVPPPSIAACEVDATSLPHWRRRLTEPTAMTEAEALALLGAFGVPGVSSTVADDLATALDAAGTMGYPVALKSAAPGMQHKSEAGGVKLALGGASALTAAYRELSARLGPRVVVQPMAPPGTEIALGMVNDPQYGPVLMVGAGGTLVEIARDRSFALAPLDQRRAEAMLKGLSIHCVLAGTRGRAPADMPALLRAVVAFSRLVSALGDLITEMDVNPLIAGPAGCVAVDALIVHRACASGASKA